MRGIICLSLLLALAGCYSTADQAQATCAQLGYGPGTDQFWQCMDHEEPAIAADRDRYGRLTATGAYLLKQPAPVVVYGY